MRLGFGELRLGKKGHLPEMQSLAEVSNFPAEVILFQPLRSLVFSTTKKTAVSVSLSSRPHSSPHSLRMNAIQQPNSFDHRQQHNTQVNAYI